MASKGSTCIIRRCWREEARGQSGVLKGTSATAHTELRIPVQAYRQEHRHLVERTGSRKEGLEWICGSGRAVFTFHLSGHGFLLLHILHSMT